MGEFDLIKTYFAPLAGPEGLGLLDDAACFTPDPGFDLVITKDTMVEGVHFPAKAPMQLIAQRLMRVNLSDLAAKGAAPKGYLLSIAWPQDFSPDELTLSAKSFAGGLLQDQDEYEFKLFGGDTVSTRGPMVISAAFLGQVPSGRMIQRTGARAGDDIWVTGTLGDSYLGLKSLQNTDFVRSEMSPHVSYLQERYWRPEPRLKFGAKIRKYATACADISDGIFADAGNIAKASRISMTIHLADLPLSHQSQSWLQLQNTDRRLDLFTFGDDYELVFTADPADRDMIAQLSHSCGVKAARVGCCADGQGVNCLDESAQVLRLTRTGYQHF